MRHTLIYYALFCTLWQLSCADSHTQRDELLPPVIIATQEQIDTLQVVANRYIVLFKSLPGLERAAFVGYHAETVYFSPFLNEKYHYDAGIEDIRLISAVEVPSLQAETETPLATLNWQQAPHPAMGIITEVQFASNALAAAHLQHWQERGDIYFAEPVYVSLMGDSSYNELRDRYNTYQKEGGEGPYWWHREIKLADALSHIAQADEKTNSPYHQYSNTKKTIIAVFDSGIDYEHPALKESMLDLAVEYDGKVPDLVCYKGEEQGTDQHGCNTTNPEKGKLGDGEARPWGTNKRWAAKLNEGKEGGRCPAEAFIACPHGTHVAGIIAADGRVGNNTAGVCPFCKILNIRVLAGVGAGGPEESETGGVTDTSILNGLKYVHELWLKKTEVRVINASIGKFHRSRAVALLIKNLKKMSGVDGSKGVLVIGAAGNEDTMARTYPAALDDVLAVSATGANGEKSGFSNFGMWVDIAAPGGSAHIKIWSTTPGNDYEGQMGTSMATPVVAGVAGLMVAVSKKPLSADDIQNRLLYSSNHKELYPDNENNPPDNNTNKTFYLVNLEHVENPVPLLGFGLLDAEMALKGESVKATTKAINDDPIDRVSLASCATITTPSPSYPLVVLLLLPLLLAVRHRCRSSCT